MDLKTAAKWLRENDLMSNADVREAVETATGHAWSYGKAYALSLWSDNDMISRLVRDALKANGDLPWHGELANR